ncbi:low affinity immunoglobulin gamma Fc region receptor II-like isoform X3 [Xiphophorus couchianus]|uniref:low affinity immunoglobulin gamma Fc region receptor II-like isoform X3 n=1 Tax=Xiphophorus couchianus TaxID=32473 RepID=UPI00101687B1|nr:low affinity immunoglobulin gamma Fc region receptor II-like isoform X3 [Xiphophorus couchianus]
MGHPSLSVLAVLCLSSLLGCGKTQEPKSFLTVSPSWLIQGASVNLSCEVKASSSEWRIFWYKAVPDLKNKNYSYELLNGSIQGTKEDSFIITGQKHSAGFACRAERGNPKISTDYSELKFVWSAVSRPAASLSVSPDREQHFTSESVTLNCGGNSAEWRVRRFSESGYLIVIANCYYWGKMSGSSCIVKYLSNPKSVYWCESGSGEFSNAANITSHNEDLLLVSPVHPVTEGASVTLGCRLRGENQLSNVFFYHNDKLIQSDSRGELNISAVSQSDEGFYKCEHSGKVSPQSWMAVKGVSKPGSSSFPVLLVLGVVCGSVLVILLLLLCCFRLSKGSSHRAIQSEIAYQGSSIDQPLNQTSTNEYNLSSHDVDEAGDVTYAHIKFKKAKQATKSSKRGRVRHSALDVKGRPHDPEEGAVYSDVRTAAAEALSAAAADAALYSEVRKGSKKRVS